MSYIYTNKTGICDSHYVNAGKNISLDECSSLCENDKKCNIFTWSHKDGCRYSKCGNNVKGDSKCKNNNQCTIKHDLTSKIYRVKKSKNDIETKNYKMEKDIITESIDNIQKLFINNKKDSAFNIGKSFFDNLSQQYLNNLKLYDNNSTSMAKQDELLSTVDLKYSENKDKLDKLNHKISTNNRQLIYDDNEYRRKNILILGLRIITICLSLLLIGFVFYKSFMMFEDSIKEAVKKHL